MAAMAAEHGQAESGSGGRETDRLAKIQEKNRKAQQKCASLYGLCSIHSVVNNVVAHRVRAHLHSLAYCSCAGHACLCRADAVAVYPC